MSAALAGAEAQPVGHAGRDGQHVLDGPAQLHADDILAGIGAETFVVQQAGQLGGERGRLGRDRDGGGLARRDLAREAGAGEHGGARVLAERGFRHLVEQAPAPQLQALGGPGDFPLRGREQRLDLLERSRERVAGDRHDQHLRAQHRFAQVGDGVELFGEG